MKRLLKYACVASFILLPFFITGQIIKNAGDNVIIGSSFYKIIINKKSGSISYYFPDGSFLKNTTATVKCLSSGNYNSSDFSQHNVLIQPLDDAVGEGQQLQLIHTGTGNTLQLRQTISIYRDQPFFVLGLAALTKGSSPLKVNYISPLTLSSSGHGAGFVNGAQPRLLDMPFDNDNWTKALTARWGSQKVGGTGYSFVSLYDSEQLSGLVIGAVTHDFWKTGIQYVLSEKTGHLDSLIVYGGASTPDNSQLPPEYGGNDGTHDVVAHGAMEGRHISAPEIFICGLKSRTTAFRTYGRVNAQKNGALSWKQAAPFYWNSFGVEGVLGYEKRMMPEGVYAVSDFIASMHHFSSNKKVYLSIDSYDQGIYSMEVLKSIKEHCAKHNQELGFYFIPFAVWTWKASVEKDKLQYTDDYIRDVTLKDNNGKTIVYKDGEFGAFPLDPTHPATKKRIIGELEKARAIGAKFLKIDFLTAGAFESTRRFDKNVRSGLQAYNQGMKMLKGLIDSILGPDIFITQAISPIFPSQYTHIRFLSTDIYSHLRNDQEGFPHYGSTAASMISSSHLGWMQGTLWPFTNMDVSVMKHFQKNKDISEQDVKVRLVTMAVMGSVLGDGSDYRDTVARERALKFLNNKSLCKYFEHPRAFTPLKLADGLTENQQLSFYLPGDTIHAALINFSNSDSFTYTFTKAQLKWEDRSYSIRDFFTGDELGGLDAGDSFFQLKAGARDAVLVKLVER